MSCVDVLANLSDRNGNVFEALHRASKDDYMVQVFTKTVGGQPRVLVLMGETHTKSSLSAVIGRDVINNFDYVGIEGYVPKLTWGGQVDRKIVSPIFERLRLKRKPQFWFDRLIGKTFFGKSGRTEGSTIDEARVAEMRRSFIENLRSAPPQGLADFISNLERDFPEGNRDRAFSLAGITIFTVSDILEMAKLAFGGRDLTETRGPKETFDLEAGHTPDIWENLESIEAYIISAILASYYATAAFLPDDALIAGGIAVDSILLYKVAGASLLRGRFQTERWYERLFPLALGLIRGRNATMVNNIESIFTGRDEVGQMLAIVGKDHLPEMKLLLEDMGYSSISLPEPAQMQISGTADAGAGP